MPGAVAGAAVDCTQKVSPTAVSHSLVHDHLPGDGRSRHRAVPVVAHREDPVPLRDARQVDVRRTRRRALRARDAHAGGVRERDHDQRSVPARAPDRRRAHGRARERARGLRRPDLRGAPLRVAALHQGPGEARAAHLRGLRAGRSVVRHERDEEIARRRGGEGRRRERSLSRRVETWHVDPDRVGRGDRVVDGHDRRTARCRRCRRRPRRWRQSVWAPLVEARVFQVAMNGGADTGAPSGAPSR